MTTASRAAPAGQNISFTRATSGNVVGSVSIMVGGPHVLELNITRHSMPGAMAHFDLNVGR